MTERVVDFLEMIEIEAEHRELVAALGEAQGLLELFAEQRPVRQIGQRVMARHVGNLFLRRCHSVMSSKVATQPPPFIG